MNAARHSWGEKSRPNERETRQTCRPCAIVRVGRHEGVTHWVEWFNDAGLSLGTGPTPPCAGVREARAA